MIFLRNAGRSSVTLVAIVTAVMSMTNVARAAYTDLGLLGVVADPSSYGASFVGTAPTNAPNQYDFKFSLALASNDNYVDVTAVRFQNAPAFSTFNINLYSGSTATGSAIASTGGTPISNDQYGLFQELYVPTVGAGTYLIDIIATGAAGASFAGTVSVNPVPLPAALPLFAAALVGLGGLGWRKARRGQPAAA